MKHAASHKPFSIRVVDLVTSDHDHKFAPYQDMANAIISIARANGSCTPDDLRAAGFSGREIAERWHMANEMARIELKLMGESAKKSAPSIKRVAIKILDRAKRLAPFVSKYLVLT